MVLHYSDLWHVIRDLDSEELGEFWQKLYLHKALKENSLFNDIMSAIQKQPKLLGEFYRCLVSLEPPERRQDFFQWLKRLLDPAQNPLTYKEDFMGLAHCFIIIIGREIPDRRKRRIIETYIWENRRKLDSDLKEVLEDVLAKAAPPRYGLLSPQYSGGKKRKSRKRSRRRRRTKKIRNTSYRRILR